METSPPSPSANISAQPSYNMDYSVNYQKLQPKFKDCTFDSDKKPEYLRTWLRLLSGIVRNIPHGTQLENFLDSYLQRRLNEATTRPSFLQAAGLQLPFSKRSSLSFKDHTWTSSPTSPVKTLATHSQSSRCGDMENSAHRLVASSR